MPTAQFPTQITDQLYEVVSRLSTTLTADISASDETIPVASTAGFPDKGFVVIDNETIYYSSLGVNSLICTGGRGFSGTAASHLKDTQVKFAIVAEHFNRFRVELIATQEKIGVSGSTYTTTLDYKASYALSNINAFNNYFYGTSATPAFLVTPSTLPSSDYQTANKKYVDDSITSKGFWIDVPGTPTRVSDTQFTITDTNNANKYDKLFSKGTIIKWLESSTFQWAMVISSSYASNTVTVDILGDSLTAGFTSMKYAISKAMMETFIIPGTLATGTDLAKTFYTPYNICAFSVDAYVKTAGTTNATTFDVNDDGTTIITTKPSIASGATYDIDNVVDNVEAVIAQGSLITIDIDAVSTTPPVEAYIYLFYVPEAWRYII